ncbi:dTMP kinase [Calderihabitans maritimus]|uniref:Thymidylate kinase n=1 Tax=Calderihabitans maritimus TaxID=1246530 RepID=A0A1Z5HQ19_9FIRM|nr:dTMP kinase [Calderihabitans maritimus]GAW91614.1 thymidylate kinase [Calderihabitans maritimus]
MFITVEGLDGAGKSTQAQILAQNLEKRGYQVVLAREPGGTKISEAIRNLLLDPRQETMASSTEVLLYAAARAQLVEEVVYPALQRGQVVICDRFVDSSIAYQGYGRGISLDFIITVNHHATRGLVPDLTIYLDIDPAAGLERVRQAGKTDRIEGETETFYRRVRQGYLALLEQNPKRIIKVRADRRVTEIAEEIWSYVERELRI